MAGDEESEGQTATSKTKDAGHRTAVIVAIITGIATIVAAAIGVISAVIGAQAGKNGGESGPAATPASSTRALSASPAAGTTASPPTTVSPTGVTSSPNGTKGDRTVRYHGTLLLTRSGFDLDHRTPDPSWEDLRYDDRSGAGVFVGPASASAPWTAGSAPSHAQCEKALEAGTWRPGHRFGDAAPGTAFCMRTNIDRVAYIRIVEKTEEGVLVDITVWN
ncbi:hypothetical protein ACQPYK_40020 [Streptosporangium sp. CA-135522]|uniref:hypothetical protein n=1 Tax=Streptosporangium sp. CA-135522 TaxID=3240072 RepID=UPI003D8C0D48